MSLPSPGDLYGIKHTRMGNGSRCDGVLQVPEESQVSVTETAPYLPRQSVSGKGSSQHPITTHRSRSGCRTQTWAMEFNPDTAALLRDS